MNEQTAAFMQILGERIGQEERSLAVVRKGLLADFATSSSQVLSPRTLLCSARSHKLKRDYLRLEQEIAGMQKPIQAADYANRLQKLFVSAEKLHRQTQGELKKKGHLRTEKLHLFYEQEQESAMEAAEELIQTELYRIVALGNREMFSACRPLESYSCNLQERMRYLQEEILPVTASEQFRQMAGNRYWAVVHNQQIRTGPIGVLPGFEMISPMNMDHLFAPGEHRMVSYRGMSVMQGIGNLTNVTPGTVEQAQKKGRLATSIHPGQLMPFLDKLEDPDAVLEAVFAGGLYAIRPEVYYSAASYAEAAAAVERRNTMDLCLLCGENAEGGMLCQRCRKRISIQ